MRRKILFLALLCVLQTIKARTQTNQFFAGNGTALNSANWGSSAVGPFASTFVSGNIANFSTVNGTGTGASITVSGFNATENFSLTSVSGTISNLSAGVIPITVSPGKTLDFVGQSFTSSASAGYIKNGAGVLALNGNTYGGGFTLNEGTVIARGVNALGGNATTPGALNLNGGIVASNATRDFSGKYSAINIGGNVQFGDITGLANPTANLSFSTALSLGNSTRNLTSGNNGIITFNGAIVGMAGSGINFGSVAGTTGRFVLNGANNYNGPTTINGGTVVFGRTGGNTIPITNDVIVNGGNLTVNTNQALNNLHLNGGSINLGAGVTLTINGSIYYNSAANITIGTGGAIVYGPNATLVYRGSSLITGQEWPNVNGPFNVHVDLTSGGDQSVSLAESKSIGGNLNLLNGNLTIGSNLLTLNGGFSGSTANALIGSKTANLLIDNNFNNSLGTSLFLSQETSTDNNFLNSLVVKSSITLGNKLKIAPSTSGLTGFLQVTGGTLNSAGHLHLSSDATGTSRTALSLGNITGNVLVERFIPSARAWRLLTAPVRGGGSVFSNWQNGGTADGTGVEIWGPSGNNPVGANGLAYGPSSSLKKYDAASNNWVEVTNTVSELLSTNNGTNNGGSADNQSLLLFVTGPFANGSGNIAPATGSAATTLKVIGALQMGDQTIAINPQRFTVVGNPYSSPIDFSSVANNNTTSIQNRFWLWDATVSPYGAYKLVYKDGLNGYKIIPSSPYVLGSGNAVGDYIHIQSGQAVFVENIATGTASTMTIKETDRSVPGSAPPIFRVGAASQELSISLYKGNDLLDGALTLYSNDYSKEVIGTEDAGKPNNQGENLAIRRGSRTLMVESRPLITIADTTYLWIYNLGSNQGYKLVLQPKDLASPGMIAFLFDSYLNTSTPVNLTDLTEVGFSTNADAGSFAINRFKIVFAPSTALPVNYTAVKVSLQGTAAKIEWTVAGEQNMLSYDVEKSVDAASFSRSTTINARNTGAMAVYEWMDWQPAKGVNYYRIKGIDRNGQAKFSPVVRVFVNADGGQELAVFPNPLKGKSFSLQLNLPAGIYSMRVFNAVGQLVKHHNVISTGASLSEVIQLPENCSPGIYRIVLNNGSAQFTTNLTLQ